jgi:hypothetical protein
MPPDSLRMASLLPKRVPDGWRDAVSHRLSMTACADEDMLACLAGEHRCRGVCSEGDDVESTTPSGSGAGCPWGGIFPTTKRRPSFLLALLVVWVITRPAVAQERALLYHFGLNGKLSDIAQMLRQPASPRIPEEQLT